MTLMGNGIDVNNLKTNGTCIAEVTSTTCARNTKFGTLPVYLLSFLIRSAVKLLRGLVDQNKKLINNVAQENNIQKGTISKDILKSNS